MRRREFITLLCGIAAASPARSRAQQSDRIRHVGVVSFLSKNDSQGEFGDVALRKRFNELGWVEGRNVDIHERWANGDLDRVKALAKELVALNPDVLIGITTPATAALQHETKTIPIVFASVSDPIGSGFIKSLANPGGNITGFMFIEASLTGKWSELMRDVAPQVSRVCMLFNPSTAPFARFYVDKFNAAASELHIEAIEGAVSSAAEIDSVMAKLGSEANTGLIVMPDTFMVANLQQIVLLAARHRLPTIYPFQVFVTAGGLMSYGADVFDTWRGAAVYSDRILHGAKPSELPVQLPTKFALTLNLKTARVIGISFPPSLLATADEVIE
jgi:putative ABC transport system substrate-binding protein